MLKKTLLFKLYKNNADHIGVFVDMDEQVNWYSR